MNFTEIIKQAEVEGVDPARRIKEILREKDSYATYAEAQLIVNRHRKAKGEMAICRECRNHITYRVHNAYDAAYGWDDYDLCRLLPLELPIDPVTGEQRSPEFGFCSKKNVRGDCEDFDKGEGKMIEVSALEVTW